LAQCTDRPTDRPSVVVQPTAKTIYLCNISPLVYRWVWRSVRMSLHCWNDWYCWKWLLLAMVSLLARNCVIVSCALLFSCVMSDCSVLVVLYTTICKKFVYYIIHHRHTSTWCNCIYISMYVCIIMHLYYIINYACMYVYISHHMQYVI
jgi:hypothetical protein